METRNRKVVFSIVGAILLIGLTAQVSCVNAGSCESFIVGPNQHGVRFTATNDSGKDISGFTIEINKSGRINIAGVLVESDQDGGCGDWDVDDDEDGGSQEEMEYDNWDSTPKSGKTMWTWYTCVDCRGKDGMDGVPIRKDAQYTIEIWFTEKTKNKTQIYIYISDKEDFQIAGTDIIGQKKNEPEKAAKILSDKISIPETSKVLFVGPVGPGAVLRENRPIDDQEPVELEIPDASGTYYAFYIDDMPGFRFVHDVRYAWVNVETEEYFVVNALWEPLILEPGVTPAPFGLICAYKIKGVDYRYGEGGGKGYVNDIKNKKDALPVKKKENLSHIKYPRIPRAYNCIALVIDGGDIDPEEESDYKVEKYDGLADQFFREAASVEMYLRDRGFYVQRISQHWGDNTRPTIRYDPNKPNPMKDELEKIIEGLANLPDVNEFFLYISAHGNEKGFVLHDPTGSGKKVLITYEELSGWLSKFHKEINIVVLIDSCRSGAAIESLKILIVRGREVWKVMTTTDDKAFAHGGEGKTNSATENFMEGENKDLDNDGKRGDLGDCSKSMIERDELRLPQVESLDAESVID